jgi:LmbE family N-acetylglucosaminyl deacetylase
MATLVTFHAHPDDEAIACGGTIAKAAAEGHRVVLVIATRGEHGEVPDGFLKEGEILAAVREGELQRAADILGVARVEYLGYSDSGMMGTPENGEPGSFWQADVEEAAGRLRKILEEEDAEILTTYDEDGSYGHPDHIQVHRVGVRAADLAGTRRVYEAVTPKEQVQESLKKMVESGMELPFDPAEMDLGVPEATITTVVDVREFLPKKRAAMQAHASQIPEDSFFLSMPPDMFEEGFGTEHYRLIGAPPGAELETSLFD